MKSKTILLSVLVLAIAIVSSALIILNRNNNNQQTNSELFVSKIAGLSIELPDYFVMEEAKESAQNFGQDLNTNYTAGLVEFTQEPYTEGYNNRIRISYGKPEILGKGGSCVDDNGEPVYTNAIVAGKSMQVCKQGLTMTASYPKNPNQKIEYVISVLADNEELFKVMMDSVANKLIFQ